MPDSMMEAAATAPDRADVAQRWEAAMRAGDFEEAWRQTDRIELARRRDAAAGRLVRGPHHLLWDGTPFHDRHVLARCNHGLGDTLQFARYLPLLRAVARSVTVLAPPPLVGFLSSARIFGDVRNGQADEPPPEHDVEVEIMELPYAFRSTRDGVPCSVPYIPLRGLRAGMAQLPAFGEEQVLHVGLVWGSSEWHPARSLPVTALAPLAAVSHVRFHALQQGPHADEWGAAPIAISPLNAHTAEIAACASAILKLDLVIAVDCMAAHLAGALGQPVWVVLQAHADWRWMEERADSPWYPTMRLFRQSQPGEWGDVVAAVASALQLRARGIGQRKGARQRERLAS
jgi:hypothetical protein